MLCYLLIQLADAFEVEATKPSTEVIVSGKVLIVITLRRMKIVTNYYFSTMQEFFTAFN